MFGVYTHTHTHTHTYTHAGRGKFEAGRVRWSTKESISELINEEKVGHKRKKGRSKKKMKKKEERSGQVGIE